MVLVVVSAFGGIAAWLVGGFIAGFDILPMELDIWAFAEALIAPIAIAVRIMFFDVIRLSLIPASSSLAIAKRARDEQTQIMLMP